MRRYCNNLQNRKEKLILPTSNNIYYIFLEYYSIEINNIVKSLLVNKIYKTMLSVK